MKILFYILLFLSANLYAQDAERPRVYFTHMSKGTVKSFKTEKKWRVMLKSAPTNPRHFPKPIDDSGRLYSLTITQQNGQDLVFNDSIYIRYDEIENLYMNDPKNPGRFVAGILSVATIGASMMYYKQLGVIMLIVAGPFPVGYFYNITRDVVYTKDWSLDNQHTAEVYYPSKNTRSFRIWPDIFGRY